MPKPFQSSRDIENQVNILTNFGPIYFNSNEPKNCLLFLKLSKRDSQNYTASLEVKSSAGENEIIEQTPLIIEPQFWGKLKDFSTNHLRGATNLRDKLIISPKLIQKEFILGLEIFDTFFKNKIGKSLKEYYQLLIDQKLDSLNLVISSSNPEILNVPFEMMRARFMPLIPEEPPLALSHRSFLISRTIIEDLSKFEIQGISPEPAPLKILFVTSLPENIPETSKFIELEREQEKLIDSLGDLISQEKVVVEFLDIASIKNIKEAIKKGEHHIVHISGHGSFRNTKGTLYLEDQNGNEHPVSLEELEDLGKFFQKQKVRMVMLSACETARAEDEGVAGTFIRTGIPVVIAMRYPITDPSATQFTTHFYEHLCDDKDISSALYYARCFIFENWHKVKHNFAESEWVPQEWFTPILYLNQHTYQFVNHNLPRKTLSHFFKRSRTILEGDKFVARGFIGRKRQIALLHQYIKEGAQVIGIYGQGGIGKTTLAIRFADNYQNKTYEVSQFLGEINENSILDELSLLARMDADNREIPRIQFFMDSEKKNATQKLDFLLKNYLRERKIFLIFDNFEDNQKVKNDKLRLAIYSKPLNDFLNHLIKNAPKKILIFFTSRYRISSLNIKHLDLSEMGFPETFRLLNQNERLRVISHEEKHLIHNRLGGHPRALELLASYFDSNPIISFGEIEVKFENVEKEMIFQDLLLNLIWENLDERERHFLVIAGIFRVPTSIHGLISYGIFPEEALVYALSYLAKLSLVYEADNQFYVHRLTRTFLSQTIIYKTNKVVFHNQAAQFLKSEDKIESLIEARWHYLQANNLSPFAKLTFSLEDYYSKIGLLKTGLTLLEEVIEENESRFEELWETLNRIGFIQKHLGNYNKSIKAFEDAKLEAEERKDIDLVIRNLRSIGGIYNKQGDWEKYHLVEERINKIESKANPLEVNDPHLFFQKGFEFANEFRDKGKDNEALEIYHRMDSALTASGILDNYLELAFKIKDSISQTHSAYKGNAHEAYPYAVEAYNIALKTKDIILIQKASSSLGLVFVKLNKFEEGEQHLQESYRLAVKMNSKVETAVALTRLGDLEFNRSNFDLVNGKVKADNLKDHSSTPKLKQYYEAAFNIFEEANDLKGLRTCYQNLAHYYNRVGDFANATKYLELLINDSIKIKNPISLMKAYSTLVTTKISSGDFEGAFVNCLKERYLMELLQINEPNRDNHNRYFQSLAESRISHQKKLELAKKAHSKLPKWVKNQERNLNQ